ncbi:MAG: hypothetical protein LAT64_12645 [Phycisphaerales bacterium]|nr:hypothetical protein [Planctomycetota bacterium]MCH8509602.1 hypothetical protein [Phycisphaerales bacterium]
MKVAAIVLAASAGVAFGQLQTVVMGVDSGSNSAHIFDANTGALIQADYLQWGDLGTGGSTAKHALMVGNQIWVSDQLRDVIYRFDQAGNHVGTIGNMGIDNIKGMELVGNQVWLTNAGTNQGAPGNSIVFIDAVSGDITGSVSTNGSLFDLIHYNGQILGSNISNHNLELYDLDGNFVGNFHEPTPPGLRFPQQLALRANGNVLAAGFSGAGGNVSGAYEFDPFGNSLGIVAGENLGPRGVIELGNGEVMWSNGGGFFVGSDMVFDAGSGQYLSLVTIPTPSGLAVLGFCGLIGARRRR